MKLSQLIAVDNDVEITGIAVDSRKVRKGNLFLCIRGERYDGHNYVEEALKNGEITFEEAEEMLKEA